MNLTFIYSPSFVSEWIRQRLTDDDLRALEERLSQAPESAPVVQGTGGLRKMRFAPPSRHTGKSGSMRVGFAYFRVKSAVFVVTLYSKKEASDLSPAQKVEIRRWLNLI